MITNALSIDLEEWYHAELVRRKVTSAWPERRVAWSVEPILSLLGRHSVRATFFVVGDVAHHQPELVERIYAAGHEIGCHGWSHRALWSLAPERFAWELDEFDREIGRRVPLDEIIGFRAPTFSLDYRSAWALDTLRAHGYRYDSSVFPARNYLYGLDNAPLAPYGLSLTDLAVDDPRASLVEFPLSVYSVFGVRVPVAGGFYLRAIPLLWLSFLLRRINSAGRPVVLYLHPWETDVDTPVAPGLAPHERFVTYYGRRSALQKLAGLLARFRFAPLREVLGIDGGRLSTGSVTA